MTDPDAADSTSARTPQDEQLGQVVQLGQPSILGVLFDGCPISRFSADLLRNRVGVHRHSQALQFPSHG